MQHKTKPSAILTHVLDSHMMLQTHINALKSWLKPCYVIAKIVTIKKAHFVKIHMRTTTSHGMEILIDEIGWSSGALLFKNMKEGQWASRNAFWLIVRTHLVGFKCFNVWTWVDLIHLPSAHALSHLNLLKCTHYMWSQLSVF